MTYTYGCDNCGEFEHSQSMKDDALAVCPKCTGTDIQRLVTGGNGFQLKGGGWFNSPGGYAANDKARDRGKSEMKR